jgi:hypothetical protein
VFDWLKSFRKRGGTLALPPREERAARNTGVVNLKPYTPDPIKFLGQLAYLQLSNFEILTNEIKYSPSMTDKAELSECAARAFDEYRAIARKLEHEGVQVTEAMEPFKERINNFHSLTKGIDWYENILKVYLVTGLLDDFYVRLAVGLNPLLRADIEKALADKTIDRFAKRVLLAAMAENPQLASRLALWGRRIMGEALLELRAAFDNRKLAGVARTRALSAEEERRVNLDSYSKLEPLITELIGAHSLRMDAIGLPA